MATYKKRGYKPKNKVEEVQVEQMESTTAEVFSSLDEGASKTEQWVAKNQNFILGVIGVIVVGVLVYLAYDSFIVGPKEKDASNDLFYAQQFVDQAVNNGTDKDSLLNLALNGADGKYGLFDIITEYSGTDAANFANYSAGMAYLNLNQYDNAIAHLEKFSSSDEVFSALALGGLGDAFSQLNQDQDALGYYENAIKAGENNFSTPKFLYKAGITALSLNNNDKALTFFQRIKDDFPTSDEGRTIDVFIGKAKAKK
jgi:tetratricopeptide (TPR) repeat protein